MSMTIDLNGTWALRWCDGDRGPKTVQMLENEEDQWRALAATVPGTVHLDLLRAGIIQEPHEGLNVLTGRWVEERLWYYRRTFTSKTFAWRVCIDLDGERKLADNFFDIFPGQPYTIAWASRTPPRILFVGNQMRK